jgi:hypothetical protein
VKNKIKDIHTKRENKAKKNITKGIYSKCPVEAFLRKEQQQIKLKKLTN